MLRLTRIGSAESRTRRGTLRAVLVSIRCFLRNLPLFGGSTPATPLRVLCILALDTIHALRYAQPLSYRRRQDLAAFLDFQACANAAWDGKPVCAAEHEALQQRLDGAGLGLWITGYLSRLDELERRRPSVGEDGWRFDDVRAYRESVVRLSLATVVGIALNAKDLDEGIQATKCDSDVAALFRMAMHCQIIDDLVDYRQDLSARLPTFLTASTSLPLAIARTARAARSYADRRQTSAGPAVFPLEAALYIITLVTRFVIAVVRSPSVRLPARTSEPPIARHGLQ